MVSSGSAWQLVVVSEVGVPVSHRQRLTGVSTAGSSGTGLGRTEGAPIGAWNGKKEEGPLEKIAPREDEGKAAVEEEVESPARGEWVAEVHHHARTCARTCCVFVVCRHPRNEGQGRWRGRPPLFCAKTGSGARVREQMTRCFDFMCKALCLRSLPGDAGDSTRACQTVDEELDHVRSVIIPERLSRRNGRMPYLV